MKVKKSLEKLTNNLDKEELKLLFGNESKIKIRSISYSTNKKSYVIDASVLVSNLDESIDAYPEGLNFIIEKSWKYMMYEEKPIIISSINLMNE